MADLYDLGRHRGGRRTVSAPVVVQALQALGGAAHRDLIVDLLLGSLFSPPARAILVQEVDGVLRENAGESALFTQVFGADSYRWRLTTPPASTKPSGVQRSLLKHRLRRLNSGAVAERL